MADELEMEDIDDDNMHGEMDDMDEDDLGDMEEPQVFWSTNLLPDTDNDLSPPSIPGFIIHITSASFGSNVKNGSRTVITTVNDDGQDVTLCVLLEGKHETHPLNLVISAAMPFKLAGKNVSPVSLTGYIAPPNDMNEDTLSMPDEDDEDMAAMEAEDKQVSDLKSIIRKRKLEAARGQLGDEDMDASPDDDTKEPPNKRAKIDTSNKGKVAPQNEGNKKKPVNANANKNTSNVNPNAKKPDNSNKTDSNKNSNTSNTSNVNSNTNANNNSNAGTKLSKNQKKKNKKNAKAAAAAAAGGNETGVNANANVNANESTKQQVEEVDNNNNNNTNKEVNEGNKKESSDEVEQVPNQSPKDEVANKDSKKSNSDFQTVKGGIKIKDLKVGTGAVIKPNQKVRVYYVGQLNDDKTKIFDKNIVDDGFTFTFGKGEVIKGWDFGMTGMKVGGKRRIQVPASAGYGKQGTSNIPPNSDLLFTVEVLGVN